MCCLDARAVPTDPRVKFEGDNPGVREMFLAPRRLALELGDWSEPSQTNNYTLED